MTYFLTFTLAFCSVVYELLLGQTLSAFLGNTVLRYSVTIGLYMFSMGIGALLARKKILDNPVVSLQVVELLLMLFGGYSLIFLFLIDYVGAPLFLFSLIAHSLVIIIGILTGLEIPLLAAIKNMEKPGSENRVLGVDYFGAFIGTLTFAFLFYPSIGLTPSAFMIATLNAVAGILLIFYYRKVSQESRRVFRLCLAANSAFLFILIYSGIKADTLNEFLLSLYLAA